MALICAPVNSFSVEFHFEQRIQDELVPGAVEIAAPVEQALRDGNPQRRVRTPCRSSTALQLRGVFTD
jgi:hypothetical protein